MERSLQKTLEQRRAAHAWQCVNRCLEDAIQALEKAIQREGDAKRAGRLRKELDQLRSGGGADEWRKKYGSLARRVPMLVLINGLGQTLAFLRAKGKDDPGDEHNILFQHLSTWTMSQVAPDAGNKDLLSWILEKDSASYRRATAEALAYLAWLKRFAEAELPTEEA